MRKLKVFSNIEKDNFFLKKWSAKNILNHLKYSKTIC